MKTLIQELGELVARSPGVKVQYQQSEMLVTHPVGNGRTQTVRVMTATGAHANFVAVRFQSRVGVARDAKLVRSALRANAGPSLGGLALELSTKPPVLDVMYSMIVDIRQVDVNAIFVALHEVAEYADIVEEQISGKDEF